LIEESNQGLVGQDSPVNLSRITFPNQYQEKLAQAKTRDGILVHFLVLNVSQLSPAFIYPITFD